MHVCLGSSSHANTYLTYVIRKTREYVIYVPSLFHMCVCHDSSSYANHILYIYSTQRVNMSYMCHHSFICMYVCMFAMSHRHTQIISCIYTENNAWICHKYAITHSYVCAPWLIVIYKKIFCIWTRNNAWICHVCDILSMCHDVIIYVPWLISQYANSIVDMYSE